MLTFRALHLQWAIFSDLQLPLVQSWGRPRRSQVKYYQDPIFCSSREFQATHWIGSKDLHQRAVLSGFFWRQDCFLCQSWPQTWKAHWRDLRTRSGNREQTLLIGPRFRTFNLWTSTRSRKRPRSRWNFLMRLTTRCSPSKIGTIKTTSLTSLQWSDFLSRRRLKMTLPRPLRRLWASRIRCLNPSSKNSICPRSTWRKRTWGCRLPQLRRICRRQGKRP